MLILTSSSKLKVMRVDSEAKESSIEVEMVREQYGISDKEATDFQISPNGKFIYVSGKDNQIRVYDYFLRGKLLAAV